MLGLAHIATLMGCVVDVGWVGHKARGRGWKGREHRYSFGVGHIAKETTRVNGRRWLATCFSRGIIPFFVDI